MLRVREILFFQIKKIQSNNRNVRYCINFINTFNTAH